MARETKSLGSLLKKDVKSEFTLECVDEVQTFLIEQRSSLKVLTFPDLAAEFPGDKPLQFIADAFADGLGAVIEED